MDDDLYQKLLGLALNFVSIRPRSQKEIREYLQKKITRWHANSDLLEKLFGRLTELGYVDDLNFARVFISSRNQFRPKGNSLLRLELKRKGISQDCIDTALEGSGSDMSTNEADLAQKAAIKKLRGLHRYDKRQQRNKLYAFLSRRGFALDTISSVIDGLFPKGLQ
jgi:regulatory protein